MFKTIRFCEKGSNERVREEAFKFFIDYLDDCERGTYIDVIVYACTLLINVSVLSQ